MFTVSIKGEPQKKDKRFVKLSFIFYVPGYNRVPKVIHNVTGLYVEWDNKLQSFTTTSSENIEKNLYLLHLKNQYIKVGEEWEKLQRPFSPIELSHFFEKSEDLDKAKPPPKVLKVSEVIQERKEYFRTKKRFKNGKLFEGSQKTVKWYANSERELKKFTKITYNKDFNNLFFSDITQSFLDDYIVYLKMEGVKKGNKAGLMQKLRNLRAIVYYAEDISIPNVNPKIFFEDDNIRQKMKSKKFKPKTVAAEIYTQLELMDKSELTDEEILHIDVVLFSYYAGGIGNVDVCHLNETSIKNGILEYERIKFPKEAKVQLITKAKQIIDKYRGKGIDDYIFPIFTRKQVTEKQKTSKVDRFSTQVNKTLEKVTKMLKINEKVTWYSSRGTHITQMINKGLNVFDIAMQAGNSPKTIQIHYYKPNEQKILETMEAGL